ncbi:rhomboid family intramembrane serine protease [candidate division KSB1 bacterium]|nr:rhomboid family intramembrane serine protease [candidate division KSB1 bacterium]
MDYYDRKYYFGGFEFALTKAVKYLLISNIAIYFILAISGEAVTSVVFDWFAFSLDNFFFKLRFWTVFTYMFLHGGIGHVLFNMLALWMFGCEVERVWGARGFFKYYIICGIGGAAFHLLFNIFGVDYPVIGASGAIYGVLVAYAVLFRERVITLLLFLIIPIRIKAKYLILILFGMSFLYFALLGGDDNIAHFAHLGGVVFGFFYLRVPFRLFDLKKWYKSTPAKSSMSIVSRPKKHVQDAREKVDEILDKINEVGYENLTENDKRLLTEYSKLLSKEQKE